MLGHPTWKASFLLLLLLLLLLPTCTRSEPPPVKPPAPTTKPIASAPAPTAAPTATPAPTTAPETQPEVEESPKLPDGFVWVADEGETACGTLRIQRPTESDDQTERFIRVIGADNKLVYEAHGRSAIVDGNKWRHHLSGEFCGDLTGDGVPEIVLTERTDGAHCCYTHYAVAMTSPPKRLLMWEKGDAGTDILPVKYKQGAEWQIEGSVVLLYPDNHGIELYLSYADSPIIPVVFSLVRGEYLMTSLSFPEAYSKHRDELRGYCLKKGEELPCYSVAEWIDSVAIGDWNTEKKKWDGESRATLEKHTPTMKKILAKLGSAQKPVRTSP